MTHDSWVMSTTVAPSIRQVGLVENVAKSGICMAIDHSKFPNSRAVGYSIALDLETPMLDVVVSCSRRLIMEA